MQRLFPVRVGETVAEQFAASTSSWSTAPSSASTAASPPCVDQGDNGTRELLADILVSEEDHIDWLETQQETIRQIGLEHYLAQQLARLVHR